MTQKIGGNSVLPARREPITLETADGLSLVGELALPADRDPVATMICLHPLPTHGGMMDSHIFRKAAYRLPGWPGSRSCASTPAERPASKARAMVPSRTPWGSGSTSLRPWSTPSSPSCPTSGWWAGPSAPTWP
ncbi:hypothetical protein [Aeromicrobium sp. UC242_57]|uniref:hypothetical protein n=1 Tax=Aeromicrobium sp. UC242_57 TaxID=3374624 RepID=UPI0037AF5164